MSTRHTYAEGEREREESGDLNHGTTQHKTRGGRNTLLRIASYCTCVACARFTCTVPLPYSRVRCTGVLQRRRRSTTKSPPAKTAILRYCDIQLAHPSLVLGPLIESRKHDVGMYTLSPRQTQHTITGLLRRDPPSLQPFEGTQRARTVPVLNA